MGGNKGHLYHSFSSETKRRRESDIISNTTACVTLPFSDWSTISRLVHCRLRLNLSHHNPAERERCLVELIASVGQGEGKHPWVTSISQTNHACRRQALNQCCFSERCSGWHWFSLQHVGSKQEEPGTGSSQSQPPNKSHNAVWSSNQIM